jgi:phenylacetate-coenzyme A ligase PaaK-like adenylate-forming protein
LLKREPKSVKTIEDIPFLPIEFFKTHSILTGQLKTEKIFESSGTTGAISSKHYVADIKLYEESFMHSFNLFYGAPEDWYILALLPSYLERGNSSLVFMVDQLIKVAAPGSGFFIHNLEELAATLEHLKMQNKKILLIGVTYALLDFAEQFPIDLQNITIMETGGMKGRREELTRLQVHTLLNEKLKAKKIHSEYGMTELLSQAYSEGDGIFRTPPWMKVMKRDLYNPRSVSINTGRGGLNVIDLANIYSCAFIATEDLVHLKADGTFEVEGRIDHAAIRGCNLMLSS